jgi:hypothetical protein
MVTLCLLLIVTGLICPMALASNNTSLSDSLKDVKYVKAQYAGNIGFVSVGAGKTFWNQKVTLDLSYGYLPKTLNGVSVHTVAFKSIYHFKGKQLGKSRVGIYTGAGVTYNVTSNTYVRYPDYYPEGYYDSNAFHLIPFIGTKLSVPIDTRHFNRMSVYSEFGSIDYQIWYAIENKTIKLNQIWNFSFGLAFGLKEKGNKS